MFTAIAFYLTYSRNRKSEHIKIAREIRDKINLAIQKFNEFSTSNAYPQDGAPGDKRKWSDGFISALDGVQAYTRYLTYLVEQREIDDTNVFNYYRIGMSNTLKLLDKSYDLVEQKPVLPSSAMCESCKYNHIEIPDFMRIWKIKSLPKD